MVCDLEPCSLFCGQVCAQMVPLRSPFPGLCRAFVFERWGATTVRPASVSGVSYTHPTPPLPSLGCHTGLTQMLAPAKTSVASGWLAWRVVGVHRGAWS